VQKLIILLLLINLASIQAAPEESPVVSADRQLIQQLYSNWREAVHTADIPRYLEALHPDVRLIPPGAEVIDGAANYAKFLAPVFESANYKIEIKQAQVIDVVGDFAVAEYEYIIHLRLKNPEKNVAEPGALTASRTEVRYFDVLRKTDGKWGVWRHTWQ
jgi:ketosteroid isomerase-like protein